MFLLKKADNFKIPEFSGLSCFEIAHTNLFTCLLSSSIKKAGICYDQTHKKNCCQWKSTNGVCNSIRSMYANVQLLDCSDHDFDSIKNQNETLFFISLFYKQMWVDECINMIWILFCFSISGHFVHGLFVFSSISLTAFWMSIGTISTPHIVIKDDNSCGE